MFLSPSKATKESVEAAAAGDADGDDPMGVSDPPTAEGDGGGGGGAAAGRGSALSAGGGLKRPLNPLADENDALETVRNIRRRLVLGGGGGGGDGDDGNGDTGGDGGRSGDGLEGSSDGAVANGSAAVAAEASGRDGTVAKAGGEGARVQISNADLAELLRSTKPKGDPRRWAKVLYRAQNSRRGTHAGGERIRTVEP